MINIDNLKFDFNPFPYGIAENIIDNDIYNVLTDEFPNIKSLTVSKEKNDQIKFKKFSLSSKNNKDLFYKTVNKTKILKTLINYFLSYKFKKYLINKLKKKYINFGINIQKPSLKTSIKNALYPFAPSFLTSKFQDVEIYIELSSIPSDNGMIKPHTDSQHKLASIVIPVTSDNWPDNYAAGTNFLEPLDKKKTFNFVNKTLEFKETKIINTVPFKRNQFLIFLKTYNSLHSVGPIQHPNKNIFRNSLTLTVEKKIKI